MVFVDKMGTMFLGGPPLVEAATGEKVTAEELGGAMLHSSVSGCADYFARDEEESAAYVRSIFETLNIPGEHLLFSSSFNSSRLEFATTRKAAVEPNVEYDILDVASTKSDARLTIACLTDGSVFHEFKGTPSNFTFTQVYFPFRTVRNWTCLRIWPSKRAHGRFRRE